MDAVIQFFFEQAPHAHWIIFGVLLLAGFSLPISEDLMIILSAVLAATIIPENTGKLFLAVFFGCYFSDWICYWIGRKFGPKLWEIKWFARAVDRKLLDRIHAFYADYGFWTLLVGRFIPFGVRNCLCLAAGAGKMSFKKFSISDGIACFISNTTLFFLAFYAGKNHKVLLAFLKTCNILIFTVFVVSVIALIWYKRRLAFHRKKASIE
jgi:membrane protein DedA with SNARE-associated domain